jgi:hypothetical protein
MKYIFYSITIVLLVIWISGVVNYNTGNIMAIAATVFARLSESATVSATV